MRSTQKANWQQRRQFSQRESWTSPTCEHLEQRTLLTTFIVNTLDDTFDVALGDGAAIDQNGNTSLRAAIQEANALDGPDVIIVPSGTFRVTRSGADEDGAVFGDFDITSEVTIRGAGSDLTFIDGGNLDRVLDVRTGGTLNLSRVTVQNGTAVNAGGIQNRGVLNISDSVIANNSVSGATNSVGGGIGNALGQLNLERVTVTGNSATINGGGIYNSSGTINAIDSIFSDNSASGDGGGLSIFHGSVDIRGGEIRNNTAGIDGGGLSVENASVDVRDVAIVGNTAAEDGGGINSIGLATVAIQDATISSNSAGGFGGGIRNFDATIGITRTSLVANTATLSGGGFDNDRAVAEITDSLFHGNVANESGGGINTFVATTAVSNSTFSGNQSTIHGGGINNGVSSTLTLVNSTVAANVAGVAGRGGGARNFGTFNIANTIVSNNLGVASGREVFGTFNSLGNNLIREIGAGFGFANGLNGDLIGTSASVVEPLLSPLQDNGGPTLSHGLQEGSPAIDAGNSNGAARNDQTGDPRNLDGDADGNSTVDIGAVEYMAPLTTFVVNTTADTIDINIGNGTVEDSDGSVSLRGAILEANALAGRQRIQVPDGLFQLALAGSDDTGFLGDLDITDDLTIEALGSGAVIDGADLDRIFHVASGVTASIDGVSMQNGTAGFAAGLYNFQGNVTLSNLTIDGNVANASANGYGGGILNEQGILTLQNVTVSNNSAQDGGGIYSFQAGLSIVDSRITDNSGTLNGGGLGIVDGPIFIRDTTIANNSSVLDGGGVAFASGAMVTMRGVTIEGNTSDRYGGGLHSTGASNEVQVFESTIRDNSTAISGGGINVEFGRLSLFESAIYGNSANADGGGVDNFSGRILASNSTISGNQAGQNGAGIVNLSGGNLSLENMTITNNSADGFGGGVWSEGVLQSVNSIIAVNTGATGSPDVSGTLTSLGTNLIGDNSGTSGIVDGVSGDLVGTSFAPVDPLLSPLGDFGGATLSHLPLTGSPVIDAGTETNRVTDQRAHDRSGDSNLDGNSRTDIGAVEYSSFTFSAATSGQLGLTLSRTGGEFRVTDSSFGAVVFSANADEFDEFLLVGSSDSDNIVIDTSGGNSVPVGGVTIGGNSDSDVDSLTLTGGSVTSSTHLLTGDSDGTISLDGRVIRYAGIETRRDLIGSDSKSFEFTNTTSSIVVSDAGDTTDGLLQIARNNGAQLEFLGPQTMLGISTQGGADTITVSTIDAISEFGVDVNSRGGDDTIDVRLVRGDSTIDSGAGADNIQSGGGNDFILASLGNDQVFANAGDDIVLGGGGADILDGGVGDDSLNGQGSSRDILTGGPGDDLLLGGPGIDTIVESGDVDLTLTGTSLTGLGSDIVLQFEQARLTGGDSQNVITVEESFIGDVTLDGGFGDDTLIAGIGNDFVVDAGGNDNIQGGGGNDTLLGGSGRDTMSGGFGNDFLFGLGGSGDQLTGGPGIDVLNGGAGGDKVLEDAGAYGTEFPTDLTLTLTDSLLTGLGDDQLIDIEAATLIGSSGNDTLDASAYSGFVFIVGLAGDDRLLGGFAGDYLDGGAGNDDLHGGGSNDTLFGQSGDDTLRGSFGNDFIDGGEGDDGLTGSFGDDLLYGQMGRDTLFGDDGDDILLGGGGSDTVIGGTGSDQVNGNGGVDVLAGGIGGSFVGNPGDFIIGSPSEVDEQFRAFVDWL